MSKRVDSENAIKQQLPLHYWVFKQKNQKLMEQLNNPNTENNDAIEGEDDDVDEEKSQFQAEPGNENDADKRPKKEKNNSDIGSGEISEGNSQDSKSEDKSEDMSEERAEGDPFSWLEKKDIRGRTALLLAVTMGHKLCARTLLQHNANIYATDRNGFNVYHEALTTHDTGLVQMVTRAMERCRIEDILKRISGTFDDLASADNFYVEIECTYVKGFNDVIQIWKLGSKLRVDNMIADIDPDTIKRTAVKRRRSMIFIHTTEKAMFYDVNYATKSYSLYTYDYKVEQKQKANKGLKYAPNDIRNPNLEFSIDCKKVNQLMSNKIELISYRTDNMRHKVDAKFLHFIRKQKQSQTKLDNVYLCKVFKLKGGQKEVKSRREHRDKKFVENSQLLLEKRNPHDLSLLDYFSSDKPDKDIGLTPIIDQSLDDIYGTVSVCDEYPLDWKSQIVPVFELLSLVKGPLQHLVDLTKMPLPKGFPIKFEIPWHTSGNFKATIKFTNPNALFKRPPGIAKDKVIDKNKNKLGKDRRLNMDEVIFKPDFGFNENKFK